MLADLAMVEAEAAEAEAAEADGEAAITGETELVEADLVQAATALPGGKHRWLVRVLVCLMLLGVAVLAGFTGPPLVRLSILFPAAFVVVLSVVLQGFARRAWVKQALADLSGNTRFRFDEFGLSTETSIRQHRLAWSSLARFIEAPAAFLIFTTPRTVLVLPKRAFRDAGVASVRQLLATRITPKAVTGGAPGASGLTGRRLVIWLVVLVAFLTIWKFLEASVPPPRHHVRRHAQPATLATPTPDEGENPDDDRDEPPRQ